MRLCRVLALRAEALAGALPSASAVTASPSPSSLTPASSSHALTSAPCFSRRFPLERLPVSRPLPAFVGLVRRASKPSSQATAMAMHFNASASTTPALLQPSPQTSEAEAAVTLQVGAGTPATSTEDPSASSPSAAAAAAAAVAADAAADNTAAQESPRSPSRSSAPRRAVAWREMVFKALGKQRNRKVATFVQLATVREDGRPANRTIVFRHFVSSSCRILFFTDTRSGKVKEVAGNPWGEVCWYMADTWEQFRIAGKLLVVDANNPSPPLLELRGKTWQGMSVRQRKQFADPPPGHPRHPPQQQEGKELLARGSDGGAELKNEQAAVVADESALPAAAAASAAALEGDEPLETFCLLLMDPTQVDYLNIKANRRTVFTLKPAGEREEKKMPAATERVREHGKGPADLLPEKGMFPAPSGIWLVEDVNP